jgi:hypothetical protein
VYYLADDQKLRDDGFRKTSAETQIWWGENDRHRKKKSEKDRKIITLQNTDKGIECRLENSGNAYICTLSN